MVHERVDVLAVDAGQTSIRASVGAVAPGVRHPCAPGGLAALEAAIVAATGGVHAALVCVGLSGYVPGGEEMDQLAGGLRRRFAADRVVLASDAVTGYLGALGARPGVVVAAGTGSVALAADGAGRVALVDGTGHLLDDAGSAFAIGRGGLVSALRAEDGRGGSRALRARAEAAFGPLARLPAAVYGADSPARAVAAFAPEVAEAAREGDEQARALWTAAAGDLAAAALAAAQRALGPRVPAEVVGAGGLFAVEDLLRAPFARRLQEHAPWLRLVAPLATGLDGAARLASPEVPRMFPGLVVAA